MEITRRTDYAIRLLASLVESNGEPLSVRQAAELYDVPYSFARSIQHDLVLSGIVSSVRGSSGGMVLSVDPAQLSMLEVVESVQGPVGVAICARERDWCPRERFCRFHSFWLGADALLRNYLSSVSIKDLVEGGKNPSVSPEFFKLDAFSEENLQAIYPELSCSQCRVQKHSHYNHEDKKTLSLLENLSSITHQ